LSATSSSISSHDEISNRIKTTGCLFFCFVFFGQAKKMKSERGDFSTTLRSGRNDSLFHASRVLRLPQRDIDCDFHHFFMRHPCHAEFIEA
jgi:hypothetical protein